MARTGRPKKEFGKKDNSIHLRLSDEEKSMTDQMMRETNFSRTEVIRRAIKNECDRLDSQKTTKIIQPSRRDMMGSRNLRKISECFTCEFFKFCRRNPDRIEEYEDGNCKTKAMLLSNLAERYR